MTGEGTHDPLRSQADGSRPAPLPLDAAPRGAAPARGSASRLATLWIGVAVTVVLLAAWASAYLLARWAGGSAPAADETGAAGPSLSGLRTPASAWWSGNGAYAVVQSVGADDRPVVTVVEMATKDVRTLKGYRVVGVERAAPRIWLVPDTRKTGLADYSEPTTATLLDIAWDGVDAPPAELYMLRLDSTQDPRSDMDARWAAWDGPAGYTVSVEIDVNKGACPSMLRFDRVHSSLNAWAAKVPTDVVSFEPIGWSPSGRYFAVITQADAKASSATIDAFLASTDDSVESSNSAATSVTPWHTESLLVFSAADGSLVARDEISAPLHHSDSGPALAAWVTGDALVHVDRVSGLRRFEVLSPEGLDRAVSPDGSRWIGDASGLWIAGADGAAVLVAAQDVATGTDIYRLGGDGRLEHLGLVLGSSATRWSGAGGMLSMWEKADLTGWTAYVSDIHGGSRVKLLETAGPVSTDIGD